MPSNQDTKNDPHDVVEIAPDVVLVARAAAEFPSLAPDTANQPFNRQANMGNMGAAPDLAAAPKVDTTFRASDVNDIPGRSRSGARWMRTALMAFLFAFLSVIATATWQRYGNEAQAMMASGLTMRIDLASWLPWQKSDAAAPADTSTASPAAVATAADQVTPAAQPADSAAAPAAATPATPPPAAATSPQAPPAQDPAQTLQSVTQDVASLTQQIETLKASIAELKVSQEQLSQQLSREIAKPRETRPLEARLPERPAERRPAKLGAPPRSLGTIVQRNPRPMYPPMHETAAAPLPPPGYGSAPVQIAPGPPPAAPADASDDGVVVRPPMPVR